MEFVVDASVVVKWFLQEEDSPPALLLRDDFVAGDVELHAPAILPFEVLNALRFAPTYTEERSLQAQVALDRVGISLHELSREFARRTIHTAFARGLSMYDASYLALAAHESQKLITADEVLLRVGGDDAMALRDYAPVSPNDR